MTIDDNLLLCWGAIHRTIEKGRVIFCEGETPHFYYQIVSGAVKMVNIGTSGKEFIQGLFGPGNSFGEPALMTEQTYPAAAIADADTMLLRLPRNTFIQLLKDHPDAHFSFTCHLAARLRQKSLLSKDICTGEPALVIRGVIQDHIEEHLPQSNGRSRVMLTRQQIADMTGLRVETVIRTIRSMYRKGELALEKGKVYV